MGADLGRLDADYLENLRLRELDRLRLAGDHDLPVACARPIVHLRSRTLRAVKWILSAANPQNRE